MRVGFGVSFGVAVAGIVGDDGGSWVAVNAGVSDGGIADLVGVATVEVAGTNITVGDGSMVFSCTHPVTRVRRSRPITLGVQLDRHDILLQFYYLKSITGTSLMQAESGSEVGSSINCSPISRPQAFERIMPWVRLRNSK